MRTTMLSVALLAATMPAQPIMAQNATQAGGRCDQLKAEWRRYEVTLAQSAAAGLIDNSAPRATMRAAEDTATLTQAGLTLQLMQAHKCQLPDAAPSSSTFLGEAVQCRASMIAASAAEVRAGIPDCDTTKWDGRSE